MNHDDEFVNEIVNVNEKTPNYLMKKYKNSLDYEKLNSEDYLNYKLKEKIINYLIPLNLNSALIEKIYLLTKKFKFKIKESKLIPIVSYIVIQESGLNVSHNELFKKLKLKKAWFIKYAKYIRSNGADFNELSYLEKNKSKKLRKDKDNVSNNETFVVLDKDIKDSKAININGKYSNLDDRANFDKDNNSTKSSETEIRKNKMDEADSNKDQKSLFDDIQKNFLLNEHDFNFLNKKVDDPDQLIKIKSNSETPLKDNCSKESSLQVKKLEHKNIFPISLKPDSSINYNQNIFSSHSEDLVMEKNQIKHILANYMLRLKEYIKNNSSDIKNYYVNDLGENTKKNKNYSYNPVKIEEKIESIYSSIFYRKNNPQTLHKKDNDEAMLKEGLINTKNSEMSFDYLKKFDEILTQSKSIIDKKYSLLKDLNVNKNQFCISILRYLLEHHGLKIKLKIFKDLFDINISSISKTCKLFKENNLI